MQPHLRALNLVAGVAVVMPTVVLLAVELPE
jgi:hypothetical protein